MKKHFKKIWPLFLILSFVIISLPFITSCSQDNTKIPDVDATSIVNLIFPQPIVFAAQILATVILLFMVIKLVWKPYNKMIEKRKEYVMSGINEVEKKKLEIFEKENDLKIRYMNTQEEITSMIEEAKYKSNYIISESEKEAKLNSEKLMNESKIEIERLKEKMKKDLQSENVDVIISAASELMMKNVDSNDNKKFVEDFLSKIDKEL